MNRSGINDTPRFTNVVRAREDATAERRFFKAGEYTPHMVDLRLYRPERMQDGRRRPDIMYYDCNRHVINVTVTGSVCNNRPSVTRGSDSTRRALDRPRLLQGRCLCLPRPNGQTRQAAMDRILVCWACRPPPNGGTPLPLNYYRDEQKYIGFYTGRSKNWQSHLAHSKQRQTPTRH